MLECVRTRVYVYECVGMHVRTHTISLHVYVHRPHSHIYHLHRHITQLALADLPTPTADRFTARMLLVPAEACATPAWSAGHLQHARSVHLYAAHARFTWGYGDQCSKATPFWAVYIEW